MTTTFTRRFARRATLLALALAPAITPAFAQQSDYAQDCAPTAVHRFLNRSTNTHFLTTAVAQKEFLRIHRSDYLYDGIAYYAYASKAVNSRGVHRIYVQPINSHFFTTSDAEKSEILKKYPTAVYEGYDHYVMEAGGNGAIPVTRFVYGGNGYGWTYATTDTERTNFGASGQTTQGTVFYAYPGNMAQASLPKSRCEPAPVHRFFNNETISTVLTFNEAEKRYLEMFRSDYKYQGVAFYAYGPGTEARSATYRLFNPQTITHLYTSSDAEKASFMASGNITDEGVDFVVEKNDKALAEDVRKVFRLKHPGTKRFLYAISESERDSWIKQYGVKDDGAFLSTLKSSKPTSTGGNKAPVVTLAAPGYVTTNPANVVLTATATDSDGTIAKVEFFNGATKLGEVAASPYQYTWNGVAPGSYSLMAVAVDDKGARGNSAAAALVVAEPAVQYTAAQKDAARFLTQATFGITSTAQIDQLAARGYDAWLNEQFGTGYGLHIDYVNAAKVRETKSKEEHAYEAIWQQWLNEPGQLRARASFALSEIFVISNIAPDLDTYAMASYMDMLNRNAFGNYRQLLEDVTLHPAMGYYLNMQGSKKEDLTKGTHPNENYAREVMQLFSIGLYKLNPDGSRVIGAGGLPVSTYDETVVKGFARAFSGWNFAGNNTSDPKIFDPAKENWVEPLQPWEMWHEPGTKTLFDGITLPAGQNARKDMKDALDAIYNHPNVGPFIGRQLIQRLVTSNPSPAYIGRVAAVFNNNGAGVRGDLRAVVRAVLLDSDARDLNKAAEPSFGKQREPVIRFANFLRATNAKSTSGRNKIWYLDSADEGLGQSPLLAPSVFNFFSPNYRQPGPLAAANLVAPEFQITTETSMVGQLNFFADLMRRGYYGSGDTQLKMDLAPLNTLAADPAKLIDHLNLLMLNGRMSDALRNTLVTAVGSFPAPKTGSPGGAVQDRVKAALIMISLSADFAIQK